MPTTLTQHNTIFFVGLVFIILVALVTGTAFVVQWRVEGLQYQLSDRLTTYQKDIERIELRLDKIEERLNNKK